jgi:hypothetical protein
VALDKQYRLDYSPEELTTMSADLVWQLIKDNNSFLVKRGRTARLGALQFSKEPGNLMCANSFKYSGIACAKTIALTHNSLTTKVLFPFLSDYLIAKARFFPGC